MLKKVFQSPLFNALLILSFGLILLGEHFKNEVPSWLNIDPFVLIIPLFLLMGLIPIHNRKNPNDRIKPTLMPMEFKEEDEGLKWITFQATRKVYIFFASSMPFAIASVAYLHHIPYYPLLLLIGLGVIQYLIYWYEIRKYR
ncbi:hypothetical protein JOC78_001509 [Bacillus ectoiniformans]|uniref:hypothetical protein n=1 Tax=Bacillus ectoiniformans TaxID=1494429 RepID=UPI00195ECB12|nr:hypothetical protein [Bacillus ectoiniformans]MBM7648563.1 hypothetical protein [Bacillus ectoiniformans]